MASLQKQFYLPLIMAISNELSSEIAAAMLAENKTPQELRKLKDIVLQVHTTLQKMSETARATGEIAKLKRSARAGDQKI
jgi:predicted transcriptional regulator